MEELVVSIRYRGWDTATEDFAEVLRQATWEAAQRIVRETGCAGEAHLVQEDEPPSVLGRPEAVVRGSKQRGEVLPTPASSSEVVTEATKAWPAEHSCSGSGRYSCPCPHTHCPPHEHRCDSWCDYDGREGY